ncbi:MAG: OPT/YSL family transporter [Deltaproteobacteria bacterium]|nr:OPT/YSL family transporter [Deltaproteobacteria bacterium]
MPFFQKPASAPDEIAAGRPLDVPPAEVAGFDEATWYERAFRGEAAPQLTLRAVLLGSVLGFFLAFTNLYVGLKTGWGLGVAITACIVSYSLWNLCLRLGIARSPLSILETNCMQSTASAAGYSTGSTMVSATPALLLLTVTAQSPQGQHLPWPVLAGWTFFLALLGVALAIPMKRNMINQEKLRFPSGIAAAVTLQSLYSQGKEAASKARALFYAALVAALPPVTMDIPWRRGHGLLPDSSPLFDWLPVPGRNPQTGAAYTASGWNFVLDHKLVMVAAGALTGPRICASMVAGGLLLMYFVGPAALANGAAQSPASAWREIGVWIGAPMMIAAGLLAFFAQWRTIARAMRGLGRGNKAPYAVAEVPGAWFLGLGLFATAGTLLLGHTQFGIPWHLGLLAVLLTFFLALVACRATGESDITPIGAMGKITQLLYGVLIPQNATANLMTASITANAAASSADLLTDLKSGYLLGAHPRRQFLAQMLGVFAGTAASVLGFHLLVPDATVLTGQGGSPAAFAAPGAQAWLAVARIFQEGMENLHVMARHGIVWGLLAGAGLATLEILLPRHRRFLPSPVGLGLGFILPFFNPFSMLLGAVAAWLWARRNRPHAERYAVPVASGVIAGESIVSVAIALVNNLVLRR